MFCIFNNFEYLIMISQYLIMGIDDVIFSRKKHNF